MLSGSSSVSSLPSTERCALRRRAWPRGVAPPHTTPRPIPHVLTVCQACSSNITPVSPSALRLVTFLVVWNLVKRGTCWSWFYMQFLRNVEHGPYLAAMQARRQLIFV